MGSHIDPVAIAGHGDAVREQSFSDCHLDKIRICLQGADLRYDGRNPLVDDHIQTGYGIQGLNIPQIIDIIRGKDNAPLHAVPFHYIHKLRKSVIRHINR